MLARLGIADPNAHLLVRSLASSVTAWGIAYALVIWNPTRFREFVRLGVISKSLFFLIYSAAYFGGQIGADAYLPALADLAFAILFIEYLISTRGKQNGD